MTPEERIANGRLGYAAGLGRRTPEELRDVYDANFCRWTSKELRPTSSLGLARRREMNQWYFLVTF